MATVYRRVIPTLDPRLGRHVDHDPRSRWFLYPTAGVQLRSVEHTRFIPILDQGQVGSCTGNAGVGALGTDPLFTGVHALPGRAAYSLDEDGAVALYSDAELIDGDGPYPPRDNGSSGLSIAKALLAAGMIPGYQHTFSLQDALLALTETPILIGSEWYDSMFTPDSDGRVRLGGKLVGGHEYVARQLDVATERVWCDNSWGLSFGQAGRFYLTFTDLGVLLDRQGDVTVLLPLTAPAPTPAPPADPDAEFVAALRAGNWVHARHTGGNKRVAAAARAWLKAKGL